MDNEYFIERLSGRFKIHRKGANGSKSEQIATADSEVDATLITTALNERERLRAAMQGAQRIVRLCNKHRVSPELLPVCVEDELAMIETALNGKDSGRR